MVSVLFNEPKLLKSPAPRSITARWRSFSTLQRVEIAEIDHGGVAAIGGHGFQYSSTSRNC